MSELRRILKVIADREINANKEALRSVGCCRPTMQERAMQLMGSKLEASLAIEGKSSEEGLLAMTQGEHMTTAMARALVEGLEMQGVKSVWAKPSKANKTEYQKVSPDRMLVYTYPEKRMKKRKSAHEKEPMSYGGRQLLLFGEL